MYHKQDVDFETQSKKNNRCHCYKGHKYGLKKQTNHVYGFAKYVYEVMSSIIYHLKKKEQVFKYQIILLGLCLLTIMELSLACGLQTRQWRRYIVSTLYSERLDFITYSSDTQSSHSFSPLL